MTFTTKDYPKQVVDDLKKQTTQCSGKISHLYSPNASFPYQMLPGKYLYKHLCRIRFEEIGKSSETGRLHGVLLQSRETGFCLIIACT